MRRISYLYEQNNWNDFKWDRNRTEPILSKIRYEQGRIRGRTESLNPLMRKEALIKALTAECHSTAGIEGDEYSEIEVKSAVARSLNIRITGMIPCSSAIQGLATVVCDASSRADRKISGDFFKAWHKKLFPVSTAGDWRKEPLTISFGQGEQAISYPCPPAGEIQSMMTSISNWIQSSELDPIMVSGVAHLWLLSIHPFQDGNGIVGRALSQFLLSKSETGQAIYYSLSKQLLLNKTAYFEELNAAQRGGADITAWMEWYLEQVLEAVNGYRELQKEVVNAQQLEHQISRKEIKPRQKRILQKLGDMGQGNFTSAQWAELAGLSQDSAIRDIRQLLNSGLVQKMRAGGRSTKYRIMR